MFLIKFYWKIKAKWTPAPAYASNVDFHECRSGFAPVFRIRISTVLWLLFDMDPQIRIHTSKCHGPGTLICTVLFCTLYVLHNIRQVLVQYCIITSVSYLYLDWIRIQIWIRIQEGKNDPQNRKNSRNFMFWSAGCSLEGLKASPVDRTYFMEGGLGINKLPFLFAHQNPGFGSRLVLAKWLDLDPDSLSTSTDIKHWLLLYKLRPVLNSLLSKFARGVFCNGIITTEKDWEYRNICKRLWFLTEVGGRAVWSVWRLQEKRLLPGPSRYNIFHVMLKILWSVVFLNF